ncbi:hypothetical protein ACFWWA_32845 [Streptomyces goshikiensis]|uniref:hypothetical protein n=1 Tax=Streptomyces goshikiensis TaxID=1942 RepID=UPI003661164B
MGSALAVALAGGVAPPASAGTSVIKGAYGYFDPNKDMFGLGDTERDGHGVFLEWHIGSYWDSFKNEKGNGTWVDEYIPNSFQDGYIEWRVCVISVRCSGWTKERI